MVKTLLLMIALLGNSPKQLPRQADQIEVNHMPGYTQVIVWLWSEDYLRHDVVSWKLANELRDKPFWLNGKARVQVMGIWWESKILKTTWTTRDPERENMKLFPAIRRCDR